MTLIFKYVHIPRKDGTMRKAPFIPAHLRMKNGRFIKIAALLDSGADDTVVPKELSDFLGLKEKDEMDTAGIGGKVKVKSSRIQFKITNGRENHSLNVPCLVLQNEDVDVPFILGRNSFFEEFEITFKQDKEKIVLKKTEPRFRY